MNSTNNGLQDKFDLSRIGQMSSVTEPRSCKFEVVKPFGPFIAVIEMPKEILIALTKMTDEILANPHKQSYGESLAGVIEQEYKIFKSDFVMSGVNEFLESAISRYVIKSAKSNVNLTGDIKITSGITDAWIVSQHENEYNPMHNHAGCEISSVLYIKVPNVKGRRGIKSKASQPDSDGNIQFVYNSASERNGNILEKGAFEFEPYPGSMLIFPSYLLHSVYPFIGEGERRSIAFNAGYEITKEENGKSKYIAGNRSGIKVLTHYQNV